MQIVPSHPARRDELFALLRACLGEKETVRRDERFWHWKHESSPFGASLVLFGEEGGRLVGLRAFLRLQWQVGDEVLPAVRAVDTATHPEHQRKGIFSRLTLAGLAAAEAQGAAFVFNTPNPSSLPGYLKMGWRQVACLPMTVRVLRPGRFAAALLRRRLTGRPPADRGGSALRKGANPVPVSELLAAPGLEALLAADRALRGPGFTTRRSPEFLHWRYAAHPYVSYFVEMVYAERLVCGALIWRQNSRFGLREVMLCDLLLASDDARPVKVLLAALRRRVDADYLIAHFGPASVQQRLLRRRAFFPLPGQGMNFTVRRLERPVVPAPDNPAHWSLCLGDLEIF